MQRHKAKLRVGATLVVVAMLAVAIYMMMMSTNWMWAHR